MERETSLEDLRQRVGVEAALTGIVAQPETAQRLRPAVELALTQMGSPPHLREFAETTGWSPLEFSRTFKQAAGMDLYEFVDRARVDGALVRLATTTDSVETIAEAFGFLGTSTLDFSIGEYTGLPLAAVLALLRP